MQKAEPDRGTRVEAELAHALAKPEEAAFDETGVKRVLSGWAARAVAAIALCFSAYQLVIAAYAPLSSLPTRVGKPKPIHDVVEPCLEYAQQVFAGDAGHVFGSDEVLVELTLENAVDVACLLLLFELHAELAFLTATPIARRRAWRRRPPLDGALRGEAAIALEEKLHARAAAQATNRTGITSHS